MKKGWSITPSVAVVVVLLLLIVFGGIRYDGFLGVYNIQSVLRYISMFAFVSLGMCFVIMTGGIDLSVGSVAAMSSVVAALLSPYGLLPGLLGGIAAGFGAGLLNAFLITRLKILPFIATLATMLAASGTGLLLAGNQSVSVSYDTTFTSLGQGDLLSFMRPAWVDADGGGWFAQAIGFIFSFPTPAWMALFAYIVGAFLLAHTPFGRHVLAIGFTVWGRATHRRYRVGALCNCFSGGWWNTTDWRARIDWGHLDWGVIIGPYLHNSKL
jgi:galactofuranose transport system permease protein